MSKKGATNKTTPDAGTSNGHSTKNGHIAQLIAWFQTVVMRLWDYWTVGIWRDKRQNLWVNSLKTLNIFINSFLNKNLQSLACSLTYRTALALVPALALVFAIGRGFGFQGLLQRELIDIFPGQGESINTVLEFVNSYLNSSSEGMFVGIGLLFLLWTLISLVSNVESTFNMIWGVKRGRSLGRKITDYTAMFLILPVLLICAAGMTMMISATLRDILGVEIQSPIIKVLVNVGSWVFTWLFFSGVIALIPNTRVRFGNALLAGILTGTAFKLLQWIFATGLMYVTRYNAIYGSFSFIPLLMLWMQFTWTAVLCGSLICYSSQNIFLFAYSTEVEQISVQYRKRVIAGIAALIVQRFVAGKAALTENALIQVTETPPRLMSDVLNALLDSGYFVRTESNDNSDEYAYQPATDPSTLTLGKLYKRLEEKGHSDFIPNFAQNFTGVEKSCEIIQQKNNELGETLLLRDMDVASSLIEYKHSEKTGFLNIKLR